MRAGLVSFKGHHYAVAFVYPIFDQGLDAFSLEAWVAQELATLRADQRSAIMVSDVTIADAAAKKVLNVPSAQSGIAVPATPRGHRGVATSTVHLDYLTLTSQFYQQVKDSTPIVEIADPNLRLPDDIHSGQIKKYFQIGTFSIGLVTQPSMNVVLDLPNQYVPSFTGLLISEAGTPWRKYLEIRDAEPTDRNNPYYLWAQEGQLYLSIVDQRGAGSGEGNMKLVRLAATGNWEVVDCYYFGATYNDPQRDGDYFGFSQHLDRQEKQSASLCQNTKLVLLP